MWLRSLFSSFSLVKNFKTSGVHSWIHPLVSWGFYLWPDEDWPGWRFTSQHIIVCFAHCTTCVGWRTYGKEHLNPNLSSFAAGFLAFLPNQSQPRINQVKDSPEVWWNAFFFEGIHPQIYTPKKLTWTPTNFPNRWSRRISSLPQNPSFIFFGSYFSRPSVFSGVEKLSYRRHVVESRNTNGQASVQFVSNLNPRMAQRFFNLVGGAHWNGNFRSEFRGIV